MTINGCYIVYRRGIIKSRNKEAKNIGGENLNVKEVLLEDVLDVPEKKIKQLQNKGIYTVGDMLRFLPRRYEDRSRILTAKELPEHIGEKIALVGTVDSIYSDYAKNFLSINLKLDNGLKFSVKWFHQNYLAQQFATGEQYFFYGKLEFNEKFGYGITSPLYFSSNIESGKTPLPIYSKISGMSDDYLKTCISQCLELLNTSKTVNDPIDDEMRAALQIEDENGFFNDAHQPDSLDAVARCHRRIAAESLIPFAWGLLDRKYQGKAETDKIISKATSQVVTKQFEAGLPYTLTTDQHNTVHEMLSTIESGKRLDALVQGDVGCGKTIVAIEMACVMAKAGFQTAVMAPTSILAEQHYHEFTEQLRKFNIPICYISGKMKAKEKKEAYAQIACGAALVVIGTQAVIGKDVVFHNLGLTIVDEEHKMSREEYTELILKQIIFYMSKGYTQTEIAEKLGVTSRTVRNYINKFGITNIVIEQCNDSDNRFDDESRNQNASKIAKSHKEDFALEDHKTTSGANKKRNKELKKKKKEEQQALRKAQSKQAEEYIIRMVKKLFDAPRKEAEEILILITKIALQKFKINSPEMGIKETIGKVLSPATSEQVLLLSSPRYSRPTCGKNDLKLGFPYILNAFPDETGLNFG